MKLRVSFIAVTGLFLLAGCVRSFSFFGGKTPTPSSRLCAASDFLTSANANRMGSDVALGVTLSYQGQDECGLSNLPLLTLTDAGGHPLEVRYQSVNPTEAPEPPRVKAGDQVLAIAIWKDACTTLPEAGLVIHIEMPGAGRVDAPVSIAGLATCPGGGYSSSVEINPYTYPP